MLDLTALLAFAPPAQPGQEPPPIWVNIVPLLVMVFVFYFILIRPQRKQQVQQDQMRGSLKKGDQVVTSGGIVGTVTAVKDRTVIIRSEDTKLEITKAAVTGLTSSAVAASEPEKK